MLLRDVPLGRAFLVATVGTIVGGTIGEMAGFSVAVLIAGGAIGCLLSAVLLRIYNRQRRTKAEATDGAA
jgi:positive regulator of sigma E activity